MKRTDNILNRLLYLVAATGLLIFALSCQREDIGPAGETCTLTYKVELPLEFDTKAAAAYEGDVDQLIYEVHYKNAEGNYIKLYQQEAEIQNGSVELPVELVRDQDYMVLFWAQVKDKNIYDTDDLSTVTLSDTYTGVSSGDFEAFFGSDHVTDGTISENGGNIGLVRAVSQLNIATESLNDQTISKVDVTVSGISKTFNVMEGKCGDVSPDTAVSYTSTAFQAGNTNIFSGFIGFTPIDKTTRVDVNFAIKTAGGKTYTHDVAGVPVKPNYKSNIIGNFITAEEVEATLVGTWEELEAAIDKGDAVNLGGNSIGSGKTLNLQWNTTIKNGTLDCNVKAWNNRIAFSKVVFNGTLYYDAGNLTANDCTFNGSVTTNTLTGTGTIGFTNCDFTNKELVINLSNGYLFSNLTFTGTKNLSILTIQTNREQEKIYPEDEVYLKSLITNNSFNTIKCICTDGEIEIK